MIWGPLALAFIFIFMCISVKQMHGRVYICVWRCVCICVGGVCAYVCIRRCVDMYTCGGVRVHIFVGVHVQKCGGAHLGCVS